MVVFFFKQKTAYEMRISDWSSDVCSSDLRLQARSHRHRPVAAFQRGDRLLEGEGRRGAGAAVGTFSPLETMLAGLVVCLHRIEQQGRGMVDRRVHGAEVAGRIAAKVGEQGFGSAGGGAFH